MDIQRKLNVIPVGKHAGRFIEDLSSMEIHSMWSWWKQNLAHHHFFEVIESEHHFRELQQAGNRKPTKHAKRFAEKFDKCIMECGQCKRRTERKLRNSRKKLDCKCGGKLTVFKEMRAPVKTTKRLIAEPASVVHVYFITDDAGVFVKIGRSRNVNDRLATLQTSHPRKLRIVFSMPETEVVTEYNLHRKFAHLRRNGEWFSFAEEIKEFIAYLRNQMVA